MRAQKINEASLRGVWNWDKKDWKKGRKATKRKVGEEQKYSGRA